MIKRVTPLALALLATPVFAQSDLETEELPEIRRYSTEIIIFAYDQSVSPGTEIFVPDPPPEELLPQDGEIIDGEALVSLPEVTEPEQAEEILPEELLDEDKKYELVMLAEEDFQLLEIYERLERLDAYKPLLHFGWTQPTYPQEETEARPLSSFVTPPEGLQGDLTLYLSRYLHLAVNLQLEAPEQPETRRIDDSRRFSSMPVETDSGSAFGERGFGEEIVMPVLYRIEEDRIFRNGELRYFDHPKFGVLAKITRVEETEENGELLGDEILPLDGELLGE